MDHAMQRSSPAQPAHDGHSIASGRAFQDPLLSHGVRPLKGRIVLPYAAPCDAAPVASAKRLDPHGSTRMNGHEQGAAYGSVARVSGSEASTVPSFQSEAPPPHANSIVRDPRLPVQNAWSFHAAPYHDPALLPFVGTPANDSRNMPLHPSPTAPAAPAAPAAAVRAQPATLLWDYDNLRPSDFGMSVAAFFTGMMSALKAQGLRVTDSVAYLVANKNYGIDPNKLEDLQVDMRLSGMKREQADRDLSRDLRKRAEQLERQGLRGVFVIVSSDKDFTEAVKALTDPRADGSDGHTAWVVHNAAPGSDHELMLTLYATGAMSVRSFGNTWSPFAWQRRQ